MATKLWFRLGVILSVWACLFFVPALGRATYDDDPVKSTQSKVVPVTKELLEREGELGPASPTYKMSDTSGFLVKKPYEEAEIEDLAKSLSMTAEEGWEDWFSWGKHEEEEEPMEVIDEK